MDLQAPTPAALLAIRKLVIVRNYRPVVSDQMIKQSYGRHAADHPSRSRNRFDA